MLEGVAGRPLTLGLALADRATGLFPRATILDDTGAVVGSPIPLPATSQPGSYEGQWTPGQAGQYLAAFDVWTDGTYATPAPYGRELEHVTVRAMAQDEALFRLLGHAGENVRDDALAYNGQGRPTTFRRRLFPDAVTAAASTPGGTGEGEIATITGSATHFDASRWETLLRTSIP